MTDCAGKFSLTLSPQALPGHCGGCGRATDKLGFIDTGLQFDFYGALIFCSECVLNMASKFGYINMETADNLKSRVAQLESETLHQRAAILGLEEALDGIQTARSNLGAPDLSLKPESINGSDASGIPSQEEGVGNTVAPSEESGINGGNPETDESSVVKEPVGVSSSTGYVDLDEL